MKKQNIAMVSSDRSGPIGPLPKNADESCILGRQFGQLKVIEPTTQFIDGSKVWRCQCDCGNSFFWAPEKDLLSGKITNCGCKQRLKKAKDLTGKRFGHLLAVKFQGQIHKGCNLWQCKCDCGNVIEASSMELSSGSKTSCGCCDEQKLNLAGKKSGMITVIKRTDKKLRGSFLWECKCDCGRKILVPAGRLIREEVKSCGCQKTNHFKKDLSGFRSGKLVADKPTNERKNGRIVWLCNCDCGKTGVKVPSSDLLSGKTTSCGCDKKQVTK